MRIYTTTWERSGRMLGNVSCFVKAELGRTVKVRGVMIFREVFVKTRTENGGESHS